MSKDGHVVAGPHGRIELPGSTLAALVIRAAEIVDGARVRRPRRGLEVELDGGRARVSLELAVRRGLVLPDVARAVQSSVASSLGAMTGLSVGGVDVSIDELDG
jgi:uncharacterized alkaline shock family protein YloU